MVSTIVITGASGGMGRIIAARLAKQGANLALCSNDKAALDTLAAELSGSAKVVSAVVDVTNEAEVEAFFAGVKEAFGAADALLNLAGLSIPAKMPAMSAEDYDLTMDVNLKGTFLCSKHFVPLAEGRGARIINIGSMAALRANGNAPVYCTAKAAVNMFSKGLAIQLKEKDIKVTTLNPGGADTGFWGDRPIAREKLLQADDIADVMEFVLSANARIVFHEINFESFQMFS